MPQVTKLDYTDEFSQEPNHFRELLSDGNRRVLAFLDEIGVERKELLGTLSQDRL